MKVYPVSVEIVKHSISVWPRVMSWSQFC